MPFARCTANPFGNCCTHFARNEVNQAKFGG
ncbi:hypothetical protein ACVIHH_008221 [Bradyrhizobium sp. USDA 4518]